MSTIQRSIGLRQLAVTSRLVARPSYARYSTETEAPSKTTTQDKPDVKAAETGLVGRDITEEVPGQATPRHSPDYTVTVDYRTSYGPFTLGTASQLLILNLGSSPPFPNE